MPLFLRSLLVSALLTGPALADEYILTPSGLSFEDTTFALESAIIERGLVIDYTSHVGEMLERTRADMGSDQVLFTNADIFLFCSAALSRQVMEADWMNIANCPYAVAAIERPGEGVVVGYLHHDAASMAPINELLRAIADEVAN